MDDSADLLPCPFCGGRAKTVYVMRAWSVTCECGAGIDEFETDAEALAAWNTRAEPLITPPEPAQLSADLNQTDREKLVRAVVERCAKAVKPYRGPPSDDELARGIRLGRSAALTAIRSLNIDDLVKETGK